MKALGQALLRLWIFIGFLAQCGVIGIALLMMGDSSAYGLGEAFQTWVIGSLVCAAATLIVGAGLMLVFGLGDNDRGSLRRRPPK